MHLAPTRLCFQRRVYKGLAHTREGPVRPWGPIPGKPSILTPSSNASTSTSPIRDAHGSWRGPTVSSRRSHWRIDRSTRVVCSIRICPAFEGVRGITRSRSPPSSVVISVVRGDSEKENGGLIHLRAVSRSSSFHRGCPGDANDPIMFDCFPSQSPISALCFGCSSLANCRSMSSDTICA
jgi:hypothetical protein